MEGAGVESREHSRGGDAGASGVEHWAVAHSFLPPASGQELGRGGSEAAGSRGSLFWALLRRPEPSIPPWP